MSTAYITHHIHQERSSTIISSLDDCKRQYVIHHNSDQQQSDSRMNRKVRHNKPGPIKQQKRSRIKKQQQHAISADPVKPKGIETVIILCSFGAPYNNKRLLTTYFGNVSLQDYEFKLKQKFNISQTTEITFNFNGIPCLGDYRKRGIRKLGILPNDIITAHTVGINLILKSFETPNHIKSIEIFKDFNLQMLRDQIKNELKIPIAQQKAIICKKWRIIDSDVKCKSIKEYETITVVTACQCSKRNTICKMHSVQTYQPLKLKKQKQVQRKKNIYLPSPAIAPSIASSATPSLPLPLPLLNNHTMKCSLVPVLASSLRREHCRYGDRCRYFNNPQISGPCRYYHPPISLRQSDSWKTQYHQNKFMKNKYDNNYAMH